MADIHSVSELTKYLAAKFSGDRALKNITVRGQISNFKRYSSGHCYFVMKDKEAVINCVMWNSSFQRLRFQPENDMQVLATGSVEVYPRDGKYQLYVNRMIPDGVGELAMAFEQLKARLSEEGLFDDAHKKPLAEFPKTIGIVTSQTGAVLRDIFKVSKRRHPGIRLVLYPVAVQGADAARQIAEGIDYFSRHYPVDTVIVGRGGGSMEDLWSFNEEIVVRAIYNSTIPVISAVGHQTDFTLADFAADVRAATPSHAAELAVPDVRGIIGYIMACQERLTHGAKAVINSKYLQLKALQDSHVLKQPMHLLERYDIALGQMRERLDAAAQKQIADKRLRLEHSIEKLELVSPINILKRGYGIVKKNDDTFIDMSNPVSVGDKLRIQLSEMRLEAQVTAVEEVPQNA